MEFVLTGIIVLVGFALPVYSTPRGNRSGCPNDKYFDNNREVCLDLCGTNLEERCEVDEICVTKPDESPVCEKQCLKDCGSSHYCELPRHQCQSCDLLCPWNQTACRIYCHHIFTSSGSRSAAASTQNTLIFDSLERGHGISLTSTLPSSVGGTTEPTRAFYSSTQEEKLVELNGFAVWKASWIVGAGVAAMLLIGLGQLLATVYRRRNTHQSVVMSSHNKIIGDAVEAVHSSQPHQGSTHSLATADLVANVAYRANVSNTHVYYESAEENEYEEVDLVNQSDDSLGHDVTTDVTHDVSEDDSYLEPVVETATPIIDQGTPSTPNYITVV